MSRRVDRGRRVPRRNALRPPVPRARVNDGRLGPANAIGTALELAMCGVPRFAGARLVSGEFYYGALSMMTQLGAVRAPAG